MSVAEWQTLLLDDGYQYVRMRHGIEVALIDRQSPFGNEYLLPRGTLREPPHNLKRATHIFMTKCTGAANDELIARIRKYNRTAEIIECAHKPLHLQNAFTAEQLPLANLESFAKMKDGQTMFNRSPTGSNLVGQYFSPLKERYSNIDTTPENLLMWFHHVPWDRRMRNGRIFWDELVYRYQTGVHYVSWMRQAWNALEPHVDARRFAEVKAKLAAHEADAGSWRDTCVRYWQEFNGRPIPTDTSRRTQEITKYACPGTIRVSTNARSDAFRDTHPAVPLLLPAAS